MRQGTRAIVSNKETQDKRLIRSAVAERNGHTDHTGL